MSNTESARDAGMCLGGFLGMFLGAMLGFAVCMKYTFERVAREDGTVNQNQALYPFLGIMAGGCVGAIAGALAIRFLYAVYTFAFGAPAEKGGSPANNKDSSI